MTKDLECPYCKFGIDIDTTEDNVHEEDVLHEHQCENCEKYFVFYTQVIFHFIPNKADCLNGGNHKYRRTHTFPKAFTKMMCECCGYKREMTSEERTKFGIETEDEYWTRIRKEMC